jgi:hypothetical protein
MTAETATEVMAAADPPATLTVRRSWALGGLLTVAVVIVAMAIALAIMAGDDGQGAPAGFPQGAPGMSEGGMPPEGFPEGGGAPQMP